MKRNLRQRLTALMLAALLILPAMPAALAAPAITSIKITFNGYTFETTNTSITVPQNAVVSEIQATVTSTAGIDADTKIKAVTDGDPVTEDYGAVSVSGSVVTIKPNGNAGQASIEGTTHFYMGDDTTNLFTIQVESSGSSLPSAASGAITLTQNLPGTAPVIVDSGEDITLNVGGYTLSPGVEVASGGTVNITGANADAVTTSGNGVATINGKVRVRSLDFNSTLLQKLEVGGTEKLEVSVSPSDVSVTWHSGNEKVVTVDGTGKVTAVGPGETTVWAEAGGVESKNKVPILVHGVTLEPTSKTVVEGQSVTLVGNAFGNAEGKNVTWTSSNMSVASVSNTGKVSTYNTGKTTITYQAGSYKATCDIVVEENLATAINRSMTQGEVFDLSGVISDIQAQAAGRLNGGLEYVTALTVATSQGILHYGYTSPDAPGLGVGGSQLYYINPNSVQRGLSDVSFVPAASFGGTAVISYTACGGGSSFNGTIRVEVKNSGDVAYNTAEGRLLQFEPADFAAICANRTGGSLKSVSFTLPSTGKGTLYYNYSSSGQYSQKVSAGTQYYTSGSSLKLENVSFLPAEGYTGTVTIPYTGTNSSGITYSGAVTITVFASGDSDVTDIVYESAGTAPVTFSAYDFYSACSNALGSALSYVYFDLPDSSDGTLYYNYTSTSYGGKVSASTRYYYSGTPYISYVTFVPAGSVTDTVVIGYTGYTMAGDRFEGRVRIVLEEEGDAAVAYTTSVGRAVTFNGLDFNEACQNANGASLSYISFTLPSASSGTLYYNYTGGTYVGTKVTAGDRYTTSTLSRVTFVPVGGYSGTAQIYFGGYDTAGGRFVGSVKITVSGYGVSDVVSYNVVKNGSVTFDADDFNTVSRLLTGDSLSSVRFTLPSTSYGRLYYNYNSGSGFSTTVSSSYNYSRSNGAYLLNNVTFVPQSSYTGTVNIPYTGLSTGGKSFTGTISIAVTEPYVSTITYRGSSLPIYFSAADFRDACSTGLPKPLSYIYFDALPSSSYGKVMLNYTGAGTGTVASTDVKYYNSGTPAIDSLCFIAKAGGTGTMIISYTAVDTGGNSMSGAIRIYVSDSYLDGYFTDLSNYSWAAPSIEYIRNAGVTDGYGDGRYGPGDSITRGQFVTMLCRLFAFDNRYTTNFPDAKYGTYYYQPVMTAKALGIVKGDGTNFYPDSYLTRQEAVVMLRRAMEAAGMTVTSGSSSLLSVYSDGGQVASYAQSAMASMIKMGIVGNDKKLNPGKNITRAEMAVMLHRVDTL